MQKIEIIFLHPPQRPCIEIANYIKKLELSKAKPVSHEKWPIPRKRKGNKSY